MNVREIKVVGVSIVGLFALAFALGALLFGVYQLKHTQDLAKVSRAGLMIQDRKLCQLANKSRHVLDTIVVAAISGYAPEAEALLGPRRRHVLHVLRYAHDHTLKKRKCGPFGPP